MLMELLHLVSSLFGLKVDPMLNGKRKKIYWSKRIDSITSFKGKVGYSIRGSPIISKLGMRKF